MATALAATSSISSSVPQTWSDLPDDLLRSILLRLSQIQDLLAFSSTCRSWRSFASSTISASPTPLFPPLLIRPLLHQRSRRRRRLPVSALQLLDPAIPPTTEPLKRSPIEESILSLPFLSSAHGHLFFLSRQNQVFIFNFITGRKITSPLLPMDCHQPSGSCIAQFTAPVSSPSCTLILLTVNHLLMWKMNSPDWISYPLQVHLAHLRQMVVVGTRIWTLDSVNKISLIELPQDLCSKVHVVQWPQWRWDTLPGIRNARLVDCEGEILCVGFGSYEGERENKVEVFGFDLYNQQMLVSKKNVGNRAIFLSAAVNVPACVCNEPERWGGEANCIYYASSIKQTWSVLTVGRCASRSLLDHQSNRSTCSFPFWDFASILQ